MRILYVCLDRGIVAGEGVGGAVHIAGMVAAWRDDGHEVAVAARRATAPADQLPSSPAVRLLDAVRGPGAAQLGELAVGGLLRRRIDEAVAEFRPDVVYERYALFRTEVAAVARRQGLPYLLEVNAPLAEEARRFRGHRLSRVARSREQRAWQAADLVVVPSTVLAEEVRSVGQPRVLVAGNGVSRADTTVDAAVAGQLRRRLGLQGRYVVGFVGSQMPWHDLDTVLAAVAALPPELAASLLVVGDGPARSGLAAAAARAGVHASFPGRVPHDRVPEHLAVMDVCVSSLADDPALRYFCPLKAMEYLAAARPAVVAAVGDLRNLVEAGAALGYPPGDAASLSRQLLRVQRDPALRDRLVAAGSRLAAENTWAAISRRVLRAVPTARSPAPVRSRV